MLTYSFENRGGKSLTEYLYGCVRGDILAGRLRAHEKLPSKRVFAKNLGVSTITVENAYAQLVAEGYLYTLPKRGFFVAELERRGRREDCAPACREESPLPAPQPERAWLADFVRGGVARDMFPFSTWAKLMRGVLAEEEGALLDGIPVGGVYPLRRAICDHLYRFRGMQVTPEQVLIGAGTEYLYSVLIQLLGRERVYGVENPGYPRLAKIYGANDVACRYIPMDEAGVIPAALTAQKVEVLHITPSHHFPTGVVMPVTRRYELLDWAARGERYLIEDDYDCEFRLAGRPIPTLQSIDSRERVIYINTFSKSLAPTFRISYLVLPPHLVRRFEETLGFYSCTVSAFEQYTLARFLSEGYFEKHINRMRTHYRAVRDELLRAIKASPLASVVRIQGEDAGLHFLMTVDTQRTDQALVAAAAEAGVRLSCISQYDAQPGRSTPHVLVINYAGLEREKAASAVAALCQIVG